MNPRVSIIIVSYNVSSFLELCLDSVRKAIQYVPSEVIVIDNQSMDDSCQMVREKFPEVILIENEDNIGFGKANNKAVTYSKGEYVLFLNPDTVIAEDFLQKTVDYLDAHPTAGSIGPKILDGYGKFAADSKKSFPTFRIAVFKSLGFNKFFPNSAFLNGYYAIDKPENETNPVDILSGCCMMVRRSIIDTIGVAFDEDYFMYCEDFDLCCRIKDLGYDNIYYPETQIIHYKGESTRKATFNYVKTFYGSLIIFIKKNYKGKGSQYFIHFLKLGIFLRAIIFGIAKLLSIFKLPIIDFICFFLITYLFNDYWVSSVKALEMISFWEFSPWLSLYGLVWLTSLYFSGGYDHPISLYKSGRGAIIGLIVILAIYGLLPIEVRYSRMSILMGGAFSIFAVLMIRQLFGLLKITQLVPYGKNIDYKIAVVGDARDYEMIKTLYRKSVNVSLIGFLSDQASDESNIKYLAPIHQINAIQALYRINEFVFIPNEKMGYDEIMNLQNSVVQNCNFKIKTVQSDKYIANYDERNYYTNVTFKDKFKIGNAVERRNKSFIDLVISILLLIGSPIFYFKSAHKEAYFNNIIKVMSRKATWIGYTEAEAVQFNIPNLEKDSIYPCYIPTPGFIPTQENIYKLCKEYARNYNSLFDLYLVFKHLI